MSVEPARSFGPYHVIAPIGEGGMGQVFKARDTRLDPGGFRSINGRRNLDGADRTRFRPQRPNPQFWPPSEMH